MSVCIIPITSLKAIGDSAANFCAHKYASLPFSAEPYKVASIFIWFSSVAPACTEALAIPTNGADKEAPKAVVAPPIPIKREGSLESFPSKSPNVPPVLVNSS